jgi:hypothetical protein
MLAALREVAARMPDADGYLGDRDAREQRALLESLGPEVPPEGRASTCFMLAAARR